MDDTLVQHIKNMFEQEIGSMCSSITAQRNGNKCVVYCTPKNPDKKKMKATLSVKDIELGQARAKLNNIKAKL